MENKILALVDYKNKFGSKHFDIPYRSGFDKKLLVKFFAEKGYDLEFSNFSKIDFNNPSYSNKHIIYTSSEDEGYRYKSFIEDIVEGLYLKGANMIPEPKFLRANNNKVLMEILRIIHFGKDDLASKFFGSLSETKDHLDSINFPIVLKKAEGASGRGVFLINSSTELWKSIRKISIMDRFQTRIKDYLRPLKHKGYLKDCSYRTKFIIQPLIPNLKNDWKIYVFGDKYYIFKRPILKGRGIKASGGGYENYLYGIDAEFPEGIFNYAKKIFNTLKVPHLSLDVAFDGTRFYLIEFQALYFGTAGIPYSKHYFIYKDNKWISRENTFQIEKIYVDSVVHFLENKHE